MCMDQPTFLVCLGVRRQNLCWRPSFGGECSEAVMHLKDLQRLAKVAALDSLSLRCISRTEVQKS